MKMNTMENLLAVMATIVGNNPQVRIEMKQVLTMRTNRSRVMMVMMFYWKRVASRSAKIVSARPPAWPSHATFTTSMGM